MFNVIDKQLEKRLNSWKLLRKNLETSDTPFTDVVNFFNQLPKVKYYTDPYDASSWPTPWQLIEENEYCDFNIILGICYTLQLCKNFKSKKYKITISLDKNTNSVYYLLHLDNLVYGLDNKWIPLSELPKSLKNIKIYDMPPIY